MRDQADHESFLTLPVADPALLGAARDAFVRGLVLCQMISGVGTLALAIFAWATFRRVGKPDPSRLRRSG